MQIQPPRALLGCLAILVIYIISVVVYRLYFHPLAKFPGPFLGKLTTLYDFYHCWLKDRHLDQFRCHEKYGSVVRYGPNMLIFNTISGTKEIYSVSRHTNIQKGPQYKFLHNPNGSASTQSLIDKDLHAIKRRIMAHGFSEQALRELEVYMIQNIDKWLLAIGSGSSAESKGWSPTRNMANWANYVTFDVLGDLCFGKAFGLIDSQSDEIPRVFVARARSMLLIGNSPFLSLWKNWIVPYKLESRVAPSTAADLTALNAFATQAIKERLALAEIEKNSAQSEARKDFIYWLLRGQDPVTGTIHSQEELVAEARLLIAAGSDTSSITLAAALYYLTRYPEKLQRLQQELRSNFSHLDDIVTGSRLSACQYLRAVIEETLRMSPPVPSSLQREVINDGITIDGHHLPAGTLVGTAAYALQHNKEYFADPHVFRPERWLVGEEGTTADEVATVKAAFCPFSLGTRGCIGKQMAYNELSIALGRLFYLYDVRLAPGDDIEEGPYQSYDLKDIFVCERHGPMVQFRKHQ